jgi:hypothetical protein
VTLLIIGGLLAVALLAILGAVFLGVTDQRAAKAQTNASVIVSSPGTIPLVEQSSAANRATERTAVQRQNLPPTAEKPLTTTPGRQQQYALNGQFHELAVELQTLYQHAWELERRLRTLAEVADRIEKTQNNQISTEEEIHAPSSIDSNQ